MDTKVTPASVEAPKKFEDSMFVKVNMEGYAVGRKVDLKAHDSYESLSLALQKMFNNFFTSERFAFYVWIWYLHKIHGMLEITFSI